MLRRVVQFVAAGLLLASICVDVVASRCDRPEASASSRAVVTLADHEAGASDHCASGCMPDCYSCSRSEGATVIRLGAGPDAVVARIPGSAARAGDGVLPLPYHPPLHLL